MWPPLVAAISPCPNDTFAWHAWTHHLLPSALPCTPHLADIEELNSLALKETFPIVKVSCALLPQIPHYQMLPVGSAIGHDHGPKVVATTAIPLHEMYRKTLAIPGEHTTAHRLIEKFLPPPKEKIFAPYHQIPHLVAQGDVDAGVIIHEQRFLLEKYGLVEILDLGTLWEHRFCLPLPLGCVVAHKDLDKDLVDHITTTLQSSLVYAWRHPKKSLPFVIANSQEKDPDIIQKHIDLYVTNETYHLSKTATQAIDKLNVSDPPK